MTAIKRQISALQEVESDTLSVAEQSDGVEGDAADGIVEKRELDALAAKFSHTLLPAEKRALSTLRAQLQWKDVPSAPPAVSLPKLPELVPVTEVAGVPLEVAYLDELTPQELKITERLYSVIPRSGAADELWALLDEMMSHGTPATTRYDLPTKTTTIDVPTSGSVKIAASIGLRIQDTFAKDGTARARLTGTSLIGDADFAVTIPDGAKLLQRNPKTGEEKVATNTLLMTEPGLYQLEVWKNGQIIERCEVNLPKPIKAADLSLDAQVFEGDQLLAANTREAVKRMRRPGIQGVMLTRWSL